ncbi:MinD/ParA family ATP-binding protein [Nocardia cyriacigeorgica]|uniref:MinD/ParA family ATP-binding protein n=1 Tax=Nocardia cyriacigeorgica TaxID=135487 RepID=UPI0024570F15|nr:MinD/ParA family protein [Nocardia cyriacigeorgica]
MSRSNDGLPMLPPWLSDSEVTQVGQQIDYEAPPVQNLPHDELIEDTPAPKRRFKRPAPEGDRSDAPGPRKEKRRKPWRRDKNDDQQVEEHADERHEDGPRTSRPADQWSNPPQQLQRPDGGWQSGPPPEQRPAPADYRPSDRSDSGPADPHRPGPAQHPYRQGPDNSWQQGPAQTGERPPTHLPTRTPSEPPAEFQPLGPRPPQPPADQQSISTEATVHLGPRTNRPTPPAPPQAPVAPQTPLAPQVPTPPHTQAPAPQTPVAPQPHASSPQIPVAPQQDPQPQGHASAPQIPITPPQAHASAPQIPVAPPQASTFAPHTPVAPPQTPTSPPERLGPIEGATPTSRDADGGASDSAALDPDRGTGTSSELASTAERDRSVASRSSQASMMPDSSVTGQASTADRPILERSSSESASQGPDASAVGHAGTTPTAEPPSWLEGPQTTEGGRAADSGGTGEGSAIPEAGRPQAAQAPGDVTPNRTSDSQASASAASSRSTDAPPAWLAPADSANTPEQPTAQRPLPRLPDLPPPPTPDESPTDTAESVADVTASDSAPTPVAGDQGAPSDAPTDSATGVPQIPSTPDEVATRRPDDAPRSAQAGTVEQVGDPNRAPAAEGRPGPTDTAVSATRGRHWLPSEGVDASADQVRTDPAEAAEARPQQAPPAVAADGGVPARAQNPHTAATTHSSGFDHPLPSQPVSGSEQAAPNAEQSWHTGQPAAESMVRAAPIAQPPRSFEAPVSEPAPGREQWHSAPEGAHSVSAGQIPTADDRAGGQPWQTGPATVAQQGRPGPQWQSPVSPGPDTPAPHNPAPMRAPTDQMPGPQGYGQAPGPMAPNQPPVAPHSAPPPQSQYLSAPQHPVQPPHPAQPPGPPSHSAPNHPAPPQQHPAPQQWQGEQGRPPLPPSLDNVPIRGRAAKKPAGSGWRKAVHHVSGGAINPGMSAEERRLQELVARIRQPVRGDYRIAVLSLKGGVGKTTTTMGLGSTFASIRGDRVIAVDANPDFGTLSQRVPLQTRSTVRDLLLDSSIQRYSDVRRHTSQATSRLEVLASERDPAASEAFNEDEYRAVARILQRFYNIILTDCGTGLMHSAMAGVLELAHSLVLISSPAIDGARSAAATLDWLSLHGHDHLVRNAVVVINSPRAGSPNVGIQQLREYFLSRCRAVHIIPFDQHMSEGAEIDLHRLHKQTKRAYVELAATVAHVLATHHRPYPGFRGVLFGGAFIPAAPLICMSRCRPAG